MEEGLDVPIFPDIPGETVPSDNVYYHGVHIVLYFNKEVVFDRK